MNIHAYPRIAIIGCPGSGKSTLAREIAAHTGHPLIHLDYHHWQPGWVPMPKDEWRAMQQEWVKGKHWIIEGNYGGTMEIRFAAADLVIFLDLPRLLCVWRVLRRRGKPRPDMRPGVEESRAPLKEHAAFLLFIWSYRRRKRPNVLALHEKFPNVEFLRVHSRKEVNELVMRAGM